MKPKIPPLSLKHLNGTIRGGSRHQTQRKQEFSILEIPFHTEYAVMQPRSVKTPFCLTIFQPQRHWTIHILRILLHCSQSRKDTVVSCSLELAIVREALTRLCAIARTHGLYADKTDLWEHIIACIPAYRINGDGAVREWQYEGLSDFYCHRHLSHLYPVFPGSEVTRTGDSHLWEAFERAVDLRELGGQSGWSFAHMAGIYARFGRGDDMLGCIDYLCRACLYDNFFTVHNDWRDNHLTLRMQEPPVQLDALMGVVNALQQMLVDDDGKAVHLFGAVPKRLRRGRASGLACRFGTFSLSWDADAGDWCATLSATRNGAVVVDCPQHPLNGAYYTLTLEVQKGMQYSLRFGNDAFCMQ